MSLRTFTRGLTEGATRHVALTANVVLQAACASRPQMVGVVTPLAGGQLQSVERSDQVEATTMFRCEV